MTDTLEERFWQHLIRGNPEDCWIWAGSKATKGYGRMSKDGVLYRAHRLSYELHFGPIGDGLCVLHRCDNPTCCNPHHLFLGTFAENSADMVAKGRSHRGERHHSAKLTENDVENIRATYADGGVGLRALAKYFGVSFTVIGSIIRRENWRHIA
jgi:hypothetical protein